jgi:TonB family protein
VEPPRQEPRQEPERREPPKPEPPKKVDSRPPSPRADHGLATQRVEVVRPAAPAPAATAAQFGQYTLLERVALGGMAEVWKARMKGMEGFQKTVAIKKILAHLTDSVDFVTMFIDEAKLAAQLNHPHIIHIYDLGKIDDDYYIAMEYVEGKDLRSILNTARKQDSPLPLGLALLVAARLASALDYAHRKRDFDNRELGLVHRDVSPQNVLISYEGDIKLCDFGIAKAVAKASKTQMGALKGKLQYMSPEQAWGRVVDGRSDIFSLGSVLFEMLTGRRLFAGESEMSVLEAVRECRLQSVRALSPAVPEVVDAIVRRALAKDPDDRFQTAGEMQKELESVLYSLKPTPGQGDLVTYMQRLHAGEPLAAGATAAAAQALPGEREVPAVVPLRAVGEPDGRRKPWVLPAAAAGIVVVGLVAWLATRGGGGEQRAAATEPGPPEAASVAPAGLPLADPATPAATPGAATPGFATQGVDAAAGLAQRVEAELRAKEEQLAAELEAQRRQIQAELQQTPAPQPTARTTPTATPAPAVEPALPADTPEPEPPPPPPPVNTPRPQAPPPPAATAREEPAAPAVREGELVAAGTVGLRPPAFVSFTKPEYPPLAKRLGVEGTVMVSVLVNEAGQVDEVRLVKGVTQNVGINEAAVRAARSARYRPATLSGVRVKTWTNLTIPFRL